MADEITSGASMLAAGAVDGNFLTRLRDIEQRISVLEGANMQAAALDEISSDMGDIRSGRFIAATEGWEPTEADFSGVFMSADGETFGADTYNIGGVNAGVLQFGLDAADGKAYFMGGAAVMDEGGLFLTGLGTLISMDATEAGVTRHATIGMEVPAGGTAPAMTLKSYEPGLGVTLITNGTFEGDTPGDPPANWTVVKYFGDDYTSLLVKAASGSFTSNYVEFIQPINSGCNVTADIIDVTEGETYYFSATVAGIAYSSFALIMSWLDADSAILSNSVLFGITGKTTSWSITKTVSAVAPVGAVYGRLYISSMSHYSHTSTLQFDDIKVQTMTGTTNVANVHLSPFLTVDGLATFNDGIAGALTGNVNGSVNGGTIGATSAVISGAFTAGTITAQAQGGTPTAPGAGYRTLYPKTDGWYDLNSGGTVARLALASEIPTLTYPEWWNGSFGHFQGYTSGGVRISPDVSSIVSASMYGGYLFAWANADVANGTYYILNVPLRAGTYAFHMSYSKVNTGGKFDLYVGATKESGTSLDTYAASQTYNNQWDVTDITIAADGWYQFKILTNGKNASSSDYRLIAGMCVIRRYA